MRKFATAAALALGLAAPVAADTLQHVTAKGVVMDVQGVSVPVTYKPDGTFSLEAMGTAISGKWRIEGTRLCTSSEFQPEERCTEYPTGKSPGDAFEISGPRGTVKITINN